jgi:histidine triad (HIT) family protein
VVHDEGQLMAFRDIAPQAPVHILIIPRQHVATLNDLRADHQALLGSMTLAAARIARDQGIADEGYRLVLNCLEGAGQSVFHVHMHLLGGRRLNWPPG